MKVLLRDAATAAAAGLDVVDLAQHAGLRRCFLIIFMLASQRGWKPMDRILPLFFSARQISTASSSVTVKGFSSSTFTPCSSA